MLWMMATTALLCRLHCAIAGKHSHTPDRADQKGENQAGDMDHGKHWTLDFKRSPHDVQDESSNPVIRWSFQLKLLIFEQPSNPSYSF